MTITIRKATQDDIPALSRICLLTGNAGKSAESLHDYGELPGLVFSVPYVKLPTTWAFVMVDESAKEVVGYVVGSTDTRAYEKHAVEEWWPPLAEKYPPSIAVKPADQKYTKLLGDMFTAPDANIAFSPAHLHINILDQYQRKGWGRKLVAVAVESLKGEGIEGVWLGLDPKNEAAMAFYKRIGFVEIEGAPNAYQLGLKFSNLG